MSHIPLSVEHDEDPVHRYRFERQDRLVIDDLAYVPDHCNKRGHVLRRVDDPDLCESFTHAEIHDLVRSGNLICDYRYFSAAKGRLRVKFGEQRLLHRPEKEREKVAWREYFCNRFLEMEQTEESTRSDESMNRAIARIHQEVFFRESQRQNAVQCGKDITTKKPPRASTLRRWLDKYVKFGYETEALRDTYGRSGNMTARFEAEERRLLAEYAQRYADRRKPTKANILKDLHGRIDEENKERREEGLRMLVKPGKKALYRRIDELDPFAVLVGREGEEAALRKMQATRRGLEVTRPLERIEMDEYKIDLQILLKDSDWSEFLNENAKEEISAGRVWVTTAIDAATRCCLGAVVSAAPKGAVAVATLNMAVNDKSDIASAARCASPWDMVGIPESLFTDGGSAFISEEFEGAVKVLEIAGSSGIAGKPQLRGRVERSYRRFHEDLFSRFDGRTFKNIVEKGDYDSEAHAVLDLHDLERVLVRYIVDVYHNTPHHGLGGETPRNAWKRLVAQEGVRLPPSPEVNRHIFGTPMKRNIPKEGILFMGLRYQSRQLQKLARVVKGSPAPVRVDPLNIGWISVLIHEHGWISVPCVREDFDGVALSTWLCTAQRLRRQYQNAAKLEESVVLKALRDIQNFSDEKSARAGLSPPVVTQEDMARLEREFSRSFDFERGDEDAPPVVRRDQDDEVAARNEKFAVQGDGRERMEYGSPANEEASLEDDDLAGIKLED